MAEIAEVETAESRWTPPSWEEIVRAHSARVYRLAYRLTGNKHDAEDLTQEVFVRVFRSLSSYTPGTFEGWLHRITTNLFLDMARRRQRIRFEGLGDETAQRLHSGPTPAQAFDERHLDSDIAAALEALAPEYRAAVVLCDIEGLSYEEIAATLGVKLGTVRSRIHRGRAQLRAALDHRRPRRPASRAAAPPDPAGSAHSATPTSAGTHTGTGAPASAGTSASADTPASIVPPASAVTPASTVTPAPSGTPTPSAVMATSTHPASRATHTSPAPPVTSATLAVAGAAMAAPARRPAAVTVPAVPARGARAKRGRAR